LSHCFCTNSGSLDLVGISGFKFSVSLLLSLQFSLEFIFSFFQVWQKYILGEAKVPVQKAVGHPLEGSLLSKLVKMRNCCDSGHRISAKPGPDIYLKYLTISMTLVTASRQRLHQKKVIYIRKKDFLDPGHLVVFS
jgi:hypothetical protein